MSQYTRTPAFTGYLAEAQRNAITKMCDKRVWGYWATGSLFGYGRFVTVRPQPEGGSSGRTMAVAVFAHLAMDVAMATMLVAAL